MQLPAITFDQFSMGLILGPNAIQRRATDPELRLPLPYITPGVLVSVTISVRALATPGRIPAAILGSARVELRNTTVTLTTLADHDLELRFVGCDALDMATYSTRVINPSPGQPAFVTHTGITVSTNEPDPDGKPASIIGLDAHLPISRSRGGIFNTARFDRDAFDRPQPAPLTGRWNISRWDETLYHAPAQDMAWRSLLPPVRAISVTRGAADDPLALAADVGLLTITADGILDPRATGLVRGTPVRLYHRPTRSPIFTGHVINVSTSPTKKPGGAGTTTITVADAVATLAATTRHGARSEAADGTQRLPVRIERLLRSTEVAHSYAVVGEEERITVPPTVWETNLAAHLDAAIVPFGGAWYVDKGNVIRIEIPRRPGRDLPHNIALTVSDTAPVALSPSELEADWSAEQEISAVKIENHPAKRDPSAAHGWAADDATHVAEQPGWRVGTGTVSVDAVALPASLPTLARALLARAAAVPPISAATFPVCDPTAATARNNSRAQQAAALEILDTANVEYQRETTRARIARITHEITPTSWTLTVHLTAR